MIAASFVCLGLISLVSCNKSHVSQQENSANSNQSDSTSPTIVPSANKTLATNGNKVVQQTQPAKNEPLLPSDSNVISDPNAVSTIVHNMYDEPNTLKIERDYFGKIIEMRGKTLEVTEEDGIPYVVISPNFEIKLLGPVGKDVYVIFYCVFDRLEKQRLADIKIGDTVVVQGKITSRPRFIGRYAIYLKTVDFR